MSEETPLPYLLNYDDDEVEEQFEYDGKEDLVYDEEGYDQNGYDVEGYDKEGLDKYRCDRAGYDETGCKAVNTAEDDRKSRLFVMSLYTEESTEKFRNKILARQTFLKQRYARIVENIITTYSEYFGKDAFVYYKNDKTFIVFSVQDEVTCYSDGEPKKYHCKKLKVELMFDIHDPHKLVADSGKYKINEIVDSYIYKDINHVLGLTQEYYDDGSKKYEAYDSSLRNEKDKCAYDCFEGLYQEWYPSGNLKQETNYVSGKRNGMNREWFETGKLKSEMTYVDNVLTGHFRSWYETGKIREKKQYLKGVPPHTDQWYHSTYQ